MKIPIRAAQNKLRGRMLPAGRQFDLPALKQTQKNSVIMADLICSLKPDSWMSYTFNFLSCFMNRNKWKEPGFIMSRLIWLTNCHFGLNILFVYVIIEFFLSMFHCKLKSAFRHAVSTFLKHSFSILHRNRYSSLKLIVILPRLGKTALIWPCWSGKRIWSPHS